MPPPYKFELEVIDFALLGGLVVAAVVFVVFLIAFVQQTNKKNETIDCGKNIASFNALLDAVVNPGPVPVVVEPVIPETPPVK